MSERFQMSSPEQGPSYRGLFAMASAAIAVGVLLMPIDLLSRTVLLVWCLMVIHMLISIKKMRADESRVRVRSAGEIRAENQFYAVEKDNKTL